ncbi:CRISPR-associated protein [Ferrovum myxofaciens]|uniref:CRISPR-associated protein n=1 Tax=Ferrovum myxofaciens TaxID=416213 RepID=A0A149VWK1_9PROT|nr:DUF1887 family CARF protein [Ferrovum myxofaciens]KXW57589.1 CRISPR-associated protein [Ferrovum myxofaciens]
MQLTQVHIVLVSAQTAPNLLPALDPAMKPKKVIMLVSKKMCSQADALENVFRQNGIKTERINLVNEHDFKDLERTILNLAASHEIESIALNVTGGTKLMAIAAQSIAQAAKWPVFYVDVDTDEVIWIIDKAQHNHKLTEHLRLRHYLLGYGFEIDGQVERPQPDSRHETLIRTLLLNIGSLEHPLSQLNWLTQIAEDKKIFSVEMNDKQRDSLGLSTLLRHFEDAGSLKVNGSTIRFTDEVERDFVKGGWLEHHVYRTVESLTNELGIRDKAANLTIAKNGVRKEMDVVFMARNRPFVIECKTARMDKPEAPKANDTLFKLADVSRVGGLGANKMLTSYRNLREPEKKLADALGISLVCGEELNRLEEKIKNWVRN